MHPARPAPAPRPRRTPTSALATAAGLLLCAALAVPSAAGAAEGKKVPVYKWVDEKGVTHYGDAIPPQYADQDKTLISPQGVPVGEIPGRRTPEQLDREKQQREAEERAKQDVILARQRDQNLLATYLSVEEIESLRDRRAEILDAQAKVTSQYIDTLRARLTQFETQVQRFKPWNAAPAAVPMPEHLAEDLVRTANEIRSQEKNLAMKQQEAVKLQEQFARDIARFRELKKIESEYARGVQPRT
jgi:hypothetical protein